MSKSFLNSPKLVRGLRNNNPGNLVRTSDAWQGKIPFPQSKDLKFEQFFELRYGIRAMLKDLIHDIKKGKNTVSLLIHEYAPSFENETDDYIKKVSKTLGVSPTQKLTKIDGNFLILLARAIMKVELGNDHLKVTDSDIKEALKILGDVSDKNLIVTITNKFKPYYPAIGFLVFFFLISIFNNNKKTKQDGQN